MYVSYVFNQFTEGLRDEIRNFDLGSRQARLALAAVLSSVLAYLAAVWLQLDKAEWAGISALIVSQSSVGASLLKGALRVAGSVAGAVLTLVVVGALANEPWLLLVVIFGFSMLTMYVCAFRTRDQYAWSMAGFLVVAMGIAGLNDPDALFELCVFRSLEIILGVSVALACGFLLGARAANDFRTGLAGLWRRTGSGFAAGLEALAAREQDQEAAGGSGAQEVLAQLEPLRKELDRLPRLLQEARIEGSFSLEEVACYGRLLRRGKSMCRQLVQFFRLQNIHGDRLPGRFGRELESIARAVETLSATVVAGIADVRGGDAVRRAAAELDLATDKLLGAYEVYLAEADLGRSGFDERLRFNHLVRLLRTLAAQLADWDGRDISSGEETASAPDVRMALSTGLALGLAMVSIPLLWKWLDLPSPMGAAVAAFVVLRPDPVATWQKALLRISGCLTGGLFALALAGLPVMQSFFPFLTLIFCFLFCAMYINYGQTRCAYFGLQAALAMVVTFYQGNGPATSLEPPVVRLAAIFVGITVSNTIANLLYPFHAEQELRRLVASLGTGMAPLLRRLLDQESRPEDAAALNNLRTLYAKAPGLLHMAPDTGQVSPALLAALGGALDSCRMALGQLVTLQELGCPCVFAAYVPEAEQRLQAAFDALATAMQPAFERLETDTPDLSVFRKRAGDAQETLADALLLLRENFQKDVRTARPEKLETASWSVHASGLLDELGSLALRLQSVAECREAEDFDYGTAAENIFQSAGSSVPDPR